MPTIAYRVERRSEGNYVYRGDERVCCDGGGTFSCSVVATKRTTPTAADSEPRLVPGIAGSAGRGLCDAMGADTVRLDTDVHHTFRPSCESSAAAGPPGGFRARRRIRLQISCMPVRSSGMNTASRPVCFEIAPRS